jgi:hypothetical protein
MSREIHQRLDGIKLVLNSFRKEQEQLILKSSDDQRFRPIRTGNVLIPPVASGSETSQEELVLNRILNTEAIIMPVGNDVSANQKLWPEALIGGRYGERARMGNIDAYGSLWKIIPRKESNNSSSGGIRVLIQAAEIGEEELYLNTHMFLVSNKRKYIKIILNKLMGFFFISQYYSGSSNLESSSSSYQ